MGLFSSIKSLFGEVDEAWVLNLVMQIRSEVATVETDLTSAISWINGQIPAAVAFVQSIEGLIAEAQAAGVPMPAEVTAAIAAANIVVAGLNAYAAAVNGGQATTSAVLDGYSAIKQAQAAGASAAASLAKPATPAPAAQAA